MKNLTGLEAEYKETKSLLRSPSLSVPSCNGVSEKRRTSKAAHQGNATRRQVIGFFQKMGELSQMIVARK